MTDTALIARVRARIVAGPAINDMGMPPAQLAPPPTAAMVEAEEAALGFPLPALLRALYLEIGNGVFGPGLGLFPIGAERGGLASRYRKRCADVATWPARTLPILTWGCAIDSCLVCDRPEVPVLTYESAFRPHRASFAEYLAAWVDGAKLEDEVMAGSDA